MAKQKNRRAVRSAPTEAPAIKAPERPASQTNQTDQGFFLNVANWLLSRLPWFKDRYEGWSHGKRILIGLLMYLIVLPVIPIVIGIILYARDPEGFRHSKAFPILGAIIAAWLGIFGLIAVQPPKKTVNTGTGSSQSSTTTTQLPKDTSDSMDPANASQAKKSVQNKTKSEPTLGRQFKNCDEAFAAGVYNIPKSDPSYAAHLDGDSDGVACEK